MAGGAAIFLVNKEFSGNHTEVGAGIFCPNSEFRGHGKAGGADIFGVNKEFSGYGMARGTDFLRAKNSVVMGKHNSLFYQQMISWALEITYCIVIWAGLQAGDWGE